VPQCPIAGDATVAIVAPLLFFCGTDVTDQLLLTLTKDSVGYSDVSSILYFKRIF